MQCLQLKHVIQIYLELLNLALLCFVSDPVGHFLSLGTDVWTISTRPLFAFGAIFARYAPVRSELEALGDSTPELNPVQHLCCLTVRFDQG